MIFDCKVGPARTLNRENVPKWPLKGCSCSERCVSRSKIERKSSGQKSNATKEKKKKKKQLPGKLWSNVFQNGASAGRSSHHRNDRTTRKIKEANKQIGATVTASTRQAVGACHFSATSASRSNSCRLRADLLDTDYISTNNPSSGKLLNQIGCRWIQQTQQTPS